MCENEKKMKLESDRREKIGNRIRDKVKQTHCGRTQCFQGCEKILLVWQFKEQSEMNAVFSSVFLIKLSDNNVHESIKHTI